MSILDAIRATAANLRGRHRTIEFWYVQVPLHLKHQMIAGHGSVEAALNTFGVEQRARLAEMCAVGIEFESVLTYEGKPIRDRHRWPWLEEQDVERAWWQAIA